MEKTSKKRPLPAVLLAGCDILLIGAALCVFALFHHVLPRAYAVDQSGSRPYSASAAAVASAAAAEPAQNPGNDVVLADDRIEAPDSVESAAAKTAAKPEPNSGDEIVFLSTGGVENTSVPPAGVESQAAEKAGSPGLGFGRFADKFTDGEVIETEGAYISQNVNVTLTKMQVNGVTYYVEDIYLRNIESLRTAFAESTYGRSITDWVLDMAEDNGAIAAINGDYYGATSNGVVIRNGVLYNANPDGEACVLFYDGTMKIVEEADFDAQELMEAGAYQAWSFGPSLLSADGQALSVFKSRISNYNPRTAIGYYEPGHYLFVVVDGRQAGYSNGMTLAQLSALFEELGAKVAYNLDGGKTSAMTFEGKLANQPSQGGRKTSDIIYVSE